MNSVSSGTGANRPNFQSAFACSILSRRDETKFHQICRGPSKAEPPRNMSRAGLVVAFTAMRSPGRKIKSRGASKRSPAILLHPPRDRSPALRNQDQRAIAPRSITLQRRSASDSIPTANARQKQIQQQPAPIRPSARPPASRQRDAGTMAPSPHSLPGGLSNFECRIIHHRLAAPWQACALNAQCHARRP